LKFVVQCNQRKLFVIINADFNTTGQLLIMYSAFGKC